MHVIFNADDFGLTRGVNLGIADACHNGVVRSTTMMVGMSAEKHATQVATSTPLLAVGVHLRFTAGAPLTAPSCLVGRNGQFLTKEELWLRPDFNEQQVADEVVAQIECFLATGLPLSHVDSHHHAHMHPKLLPIINEVVSSYRVPLRACRSFSGQRYVFSKDFYSETPNLDDLLAIIGQQRGQCEVLEIMCHPGIVDPSLIELSGYAQPRAKELEILTDNRLGETLDKWGVIVSNFQVLKI
ncbi:chitin disaccharide deacetylase [Photobacterium sp. DNB22_13_2]